MSKQKQNSKKKLKKTIRTGFDYWTDQEFNIFRTKQLARFSLILTVGALFFILVNSILEPETWKWYWKLMSAYFLPPMGKESIIPLGLNRNIPHFIWGFSIWVFDLMVCYTILTNWWLIEIIIKHSKLVNKWYTKLQSKRESMENKKYGKLLPLILLLFMLVPFQGSGAMTTTFIGSSLGFRNRHIILLVAIGSLFSILAIMIAYLNIMDLL